MRMNLGSKKFRGASSEVCWTSLNVRDILKRREYTGVMIMNNRLMVYFSQTQPVIEYYRKTKRLVSIDGNQHIDTVAAIIDKTIRNHM